MTLPVSRATRDKIETLHSAPAFLDGGPRGEGHSSFGDTPQRRARFGYVESRPPLLRFTNGLSHRQRSGFIAVTKFLSSLASDRRVSASTQNQALSAILFLYDEVLGAKVGWLETLVRAKRPARVPVVLTREEVRAILHGLAGTT